MQFSKIRLTGFKSFVDPTELMISDGLTGVVGPNGCGKSNLLEALRWVMGENRPTAMRTGGMEDVIFAGASSRPARNFAEVSLTIDNRERLAPAAFNTEDALEIVRRITRDVGSAYKTNGKDVRARDVQMLFADASTGSHSPALVRQGQISELINAKPQARRRILEEAAGISGLYQRRHEAELKLRGAETNLTRIDDVLEQLDAQLASLARQAKQAVRYREIGEALRLHEGLLLYRRWREADLARQAAQSALTQAQSQAARAQAAASKSVRLRQEGEEKVPPLRQEEAISGAILQRMLVERDRLNDRETQAKDTIGSLTDRISQLDRDMDRESGLNRDAGETIKGLETEEGELNAAFDGHDAALSDAAEAARLAAQAMQEQEASFDQLSEDVARLSARHQSAQRRLQEAHQLLEKRTAEQANIHNLSQHAEEALQLSATELETRSDHSNSARQIAQKAEETLQDAESMRTELQETESRVRATWSEADGEANALSAEVAALERVLAREQGDGEQILEQIRVQKGYEAALGAALADDLKAPAMAGGHVSGWAELAPYNRVSAFVDGPELLSEFVTAPAVMARRLQHIALVSKEQGAALHHQLAPGQRLVTLNGDLWRWDGFHTAAEDASSTAALRLQQVNRLEELSATSQKAQTKAAAAREAFTVAETAMRDAAQENNQARDARKKADEDAAEATRNLSRAEADKERLAGKLETLSMSGKRLAEELSQADKALKETQASLVDLGDLTQARNQIETRKISVEAARVTMLTKRALADDLRRSGEKRADRLRDIAKELKIWRSRLANADTRVSELLKRREKSQAELAVAAKQPAVVAQKREELAKSVEQAETRRNAASDALAVGEAALREAVQNERDAERQASEARETLARSDAVSEAAVEQEKAAAERIREEAEVEPAQLLEKLDADPENMPDAQVIENKVHALRRQRDGMGAVNLRAEEDSREVADERNTLAEEKDDLDAAIAKLRNGISSLNKEGRERLLNAFDEVNKNFSTLFKHLFGGGDAQLALVESDDPLEAGLEIMCQPPGKKLSTLSLLSGGEQTLTALSLIFAVFLANPSPICVLDEVDAPLDDANVTRFCDLLDEMTRNTDTRFLIITHNAVTMARMDRLYGVTMGEPGVSQLVSVDLTAAEKMVEG